MQFVHSSGVSFPYSHGSPHANPYPYPMYNNTSSQQKPQRKLSTSNPCINQTTPYIPVPNYSMSPYLYQSNFSHPTVRNNGFTSSSPALVPQVLQVPQVLPYVSLAPIQQNERKRTQIPIENREGRLKTKDDNSLKVFMSYLRQQYAYFPRWWYFFRLVVNHIQSGTMEKREKYIILLQILLAGKKKERKLLFRYLDLSRKLSSESSLDFCFHQNHLHYSLVYLLNVCEEMCFGKVMRNISLKEEKEEDVTDLEAMYSTEYGLFENFIKNFDDHPDLKEKVFSILQESLNQYTQFGFTSYDSLYERIYSIICNIPNAISSFSSLMEI